jgi:hypothetical protein
MSPGRMLGYCLGGNGLGGKNPGTNNANEDSVCYSKKTILSRLGFYCIQGCTSENFRCFTFEFQAKDNVNLCEASPSVDQSAFATNVP